MNAEIIAQILDRGEDDWFDFSEVLSVVRSRTGLGEPAVVTLSVELIGDMLNRQLIAVGDLHRREDSVAFSPWEGSPRKIIERICKERTTLGRRPGIGDICWLSTT